MNKILIVNMFGIGDVLFTFPMIRNIRAQAPQAEIHFMANRRTAPLLARHEDIDKVIVYDRGHFHRLGRRSRLAVARQHGLRLCEIRQERYDAVFDLSMSGSMNVFLTLAGIPQRIGYDFRGRGRFLTHRRPLKGYEHRPVAEYYLDLLACVDIPVVFRDLRFRPPEADRQAARRRLDDVLDKERPLVAVGPGGGASWGADARAKRWPVQRFAELADKIVENTGAEIILVGSRTEIDLCRTMQEAMQHPVRTICGETSLSEAAAVFELCDLAVMNDGGLLHLAAAAGTSTVSIFGPVDDRVYGPFPPDGQRHRTVTHPAVRCRPCYRNFRRASCEHFSCLQTLSVEEVWLAVQSFGLGVAKPQRACAGAKE